MKLSALVQRLRSGRLPGWRENAVDSAAAAHEVDWRSPFAEPELRRQLRFRHHLTRYALGVLALNLAIAALFWGVWQGVAVLKTAALDRRHERIGEYGRPPLPLLGVDPIAADRVRRAVSKEFEFTSTYSSDVVEEFQASLKNDASAKPLLAGGYRNLWAMLEHVNYEGNREVEQAAIAFLAARLSQSQLSLNHYGMQGYLWNNYVVYIDDFVQSGRFTSARVLATQAAAHARRLDSLPSMVYQESPLRAPWFSARQNLFLLLDALFSESATMYVDPAAARRLYHGVLELYPFAHQALLERRVARVTVTLMRQEQPGLLVLHELEPGYGDDGSPRLAPQDIELLARKRIEHAARVARERVAAAIQSRPAVLLRHGACAVRLASEQLAEQEPVFTESLENAQARLEYAMRENAGPIAASCAADPAADAPGEEREGEYFDANSKGARAPISEFFADENVLRSLVASAEPQLQYFGELLVGVIRLRAGDYERAIASFKAAAASKNVRVRDLALLNRARAVFWSTHAQLPPEVTQPTVRAARTSAATAQIRALIPRVTERNYTSDLTYYLSELRAMAAPPKPQVQTQ